VAEEGHPERSDCPEAEVVRTLAHGYVQALLTGDEARAEVLVREAIDLDLTEREVAEEIIAPAMQRIGALWERGEISVADEHLATQITLRVLVLQREAFRTSRARLDRRVAAAAVEGEEHIVGLQLAANLLLHAGYDVSYYGPALPLSALEKLVAGRAPHVFCLTATVAPATQMLYAAVDELRSLDPHLSIVVGGAGVPAEMRPTPSLAVATGVSGIVQTVDALLRRPDLN